MPNEQFLVTIPSELKEALDMYAGKRNISRAQAVRESIATYIKFDLSAIAKPKHGNQKYETEALRKEAQRQREAEKRAYIRRLIDADAKAKREAKCKPR